jgi:hypothetical protein
MKYKKILGILGGAIIFMLIMAVIPAAPVLAYDYDVSISPTSGKIGDTVTIAGSSFNFSTDTSERRARIIFAYGDVSVLDYIDDLSSYKIIKDSIIGYQDESDEGEFHTTFSVPSTLTDGDVDMDVIPGTYSICTAVITSTTESPIRSVNTFTVLSNATIDISPTSGPAGSTVQITGANFPANGTIVIKFDGTVVPITSGDTLVKSTRILISSITIPSGIAVGSHTISVSGGTTDTPSVTFTVTANPAIETILPASGPAGTDVTLSGTNFPANTVLSFKFDETTIAVTNGSTQTGSGGSFASVITVPAGVVAGSHIITVTAGAGTATATFTVTAPQTTTTTPPPTSTTTTPPVSTTTTTPKPGTTTLTINQSGNFVGSAVGIGGSGFKKNGTVTLKFDDTTVGTATADASGFFVATFQVPASKHGTHTITATDGTNTNTTTFEVESVAPKTPQPLLPEMDATIKSPITFDWEDVTDESPPVTYDLQVATSSNFAANTIVIDKSGITKSEYTLTAAEELKLASDENTYYWREKAVDGAQNESDWTGAGTFSVAQPFKFTGWPMILIIVVGAILMWLFGFWIGRKTAFYY